MIKWLSYGGLTGLVILLVGVITYPALADTQSDTCKIDESAWCIAPRVDQDTAVIASATMPKLATPAWMEASTALESSVSYEVKTRGTIRADLAEFKRQAAETLNDSRGWSRLGVSFVEVDSEADFTLWLAEASTMTSFSAQGCSAQWSCNVGRDVIINQTPWLEATPAWSQAGASLRDYRHMVVNHETGHWLGHGHRFCGAEGQSAPAMQQQSMDLQGCQPNAWPLPNELYAPTLGIRS